MVKTRGIDVIRYLIYWALLYIFSVLLFLTAYFAPQNSIFISHRNFTSVHASTDKFPTIHSYCNNATRNPVFHKAVMIIIDALRADFIRPLRNDDIFDSYSMPFIEKMVQTNEAIVFTSVAQTPTVTMPRIKAIIAGIKPDFIDLILNLNTANFGQDNLIQRAHNNHKRIIFFGDDTWSQMFDPSFFLRYNVTYSFYATDYTQVDTNVTFNVERELSKLLEWDYMILHYLGVDHIGHTYGPFSFLMQSKLKEMDSIIKMIYNNLTNSKERYIIVITGDHGMTDWGNHGGGESQEINTGIIFIDTIHPKSYFEMKTTIKQVDIAPTLSLLLGLPIPLKSIGKVILPLLKWLSIEPNIIHCYLFNNSIQISQLFSSNELFERYLEPALDYHIKSINTNYSIKSYIKLTEKNYDNYICSIQDNLVNSTNNQSLISLIIELTSLAVGIICIYKILKIELNGKYSIIFSASTKDPLVIYIISILFIKVLLLASTSFVEAEQFFWLYVSSTLIIINLFRYFKFERNTEYDKKLTISTILFHFGILLIIRFISEWNNGYFSNIIFVKGRRHLSSTIVIFCLMSISFMVSSSRFNKQQCILLSGFFWTYLYRCDSGYLTLLKFPFSNHIPYLSPIFKARLVYLHLILLLFEHFMSRKQKSFNFSFLNDILPIKDRIKGSDNSSLRCFIACWILLSTLLVKLQNIPLLAAAIILEKCIYYLLQWCHSPELVIVLPLSYHTVGKAFFYASGNTNTISTIDVSAGYVGLESYRPVVAALLTICSTYSHYIYWILMSFVRLNESKQMSLYCPKVLLMKSAFVVITIISFISLTFYKIIAILLINHLFIWTVISPKLLYESFESMLTIIVIIIYIISIICDEMIRRNIQTSL